MSSKLKTQLQKDILTLTKNYNNILLENATGTGKTLSSLKIAFQKYKKLKSKKKTIIFVKETSHKYSWLKEFEDHKLDTSNFILECYSSCHKYINSEHNLILDEVHALSDNRFNNIKTIKSDFIISLSATVKKDIKFKVKLLNDQNFYNYQYPLNQAIDDELLPDPEIFIVKKELDNINKSEEYIFKKGTESKTKPENIYNIEYKDRFYYLKKLKNLNVENYIIKAKCTQEEYYIQLSNDIEYFKSKGNKNPKSPAYQKMLRLSLQRKKFLGLIKTPLLKLLLTKLINERYICFTSSINQADEVGKNVLHSGIKNYKKLIPEIISNFNEGKINNITVAEMLKEGVNLKNCKYGIITQLDSFELSFIQRLGRVLRHESPVVFIFVVPGTTDELYFLENIKSIQHRNIQVLNESWLYEPKKE